MQSLQEKTISCPYCGESIDVLIDPTEADSQYIEDCQVCCQPINFVITKNVADELSISVHAENSQ